MLTSYELVRFNDDLRFKVSIVDAQYLNCVERYEKSMVKMWNQN